MSVRTPEILVENSTSCYVSDQISTTDQNVSTKKSFLSWLCFCLPSTTLDVKTLPDDVVEPSITTKDNVK